MGMRRMGKTFAAAVEKKLLAKVEDFAGREERRADAATDDPEDVAKAAAKLIGGIKRSVAPRAKRDAAKTIGKIPDAVHRHSKREFERLGINLAEEPEMGKLIKSWRRHNVDRVGGLLDDELDTLEELLANSVGRTPKQLTARILERLDVTTRKAQYLARNQTLTLNGQINARRQQAAGIEEFIWSSSGDERVRDEHQDLDGKRFRYDDPPSEGVPGEPPNCRCVATPAQAVQEEKKAA